MLATLKKIFYKLRKSAPASGLIFTKDLLAGKKYKIGAYTYGLPQVVWDEDANLFIGKFCSIAGSVKIYLGGNHRVDWVSTYPFNSFNELFPDARGITGHPTTKGDVIIGNDVWIGDSSTIFSGVKIGDGAVIAAGSVVTKNIGPYELWAGNPARLIKKRFDDESIKKLLLIKWWEWEIEKINTIAPLLCSDDIQEFIKKFEP